MKWNLISVVFIDLIVTSLTCKWPLFPYQPLPHTAWEEYYIKLSGVGLGEAEQPFYVASPHHTQHHNSFALNQYRTNNMPFIVPENENFDYILPKAYSFKTRQPFKPKKEDFDYLLPQRNGGKKRESIVTSKPEVEIKYNLQKVKEDKKRISSVSSKTKKDFSYFMSQKNNDKKVKLIVPEKHEDDVIGILPKIIYDNKQEFKSRKKQEIDNLSPEYEMSYIPPQHEEKNQGLSDYSERELEKQEKLEKLEKLENEKYRSKKKGKVARPFSSFKSFHQNKELSYHTEYGDNPQIEMNWKNQREYTKSGDDDHKQNENIPGLESDKFGDDLENNKDKKSEDNIFKYQSNEEVKLKIAETPNNHTSKQDDDTGKIKELYIEISDIKTSTSMPIEESHFLSETMAPTFEDRQMSKAFYNEFDTKTGSYAPLNSRNSVNFDEVTVSSVTTWTSSTSLLRTPPQNTRLITESSDQGKNINKKILKSPKVSMTKNNTNTKEKNYHERSIIGSAAIAGIIIGSFVFIALLAGAALFVIHKSPYRRANVQTISSPSASLATESLRTENSLLNMSQRSDSNQNSRLYRWPPPQTPRRAIP